MNDQQLESSTLSRAELGANNSLLHDQATRVVHDREGGAVQDLVLYSAVDEQIDVRVRDLEGTVGRENHQSGFCKGEISKADSQPVSTCDSLMNASLSLLFLKAPQGSRGLLCNDDDKVSLSNLESRTWATYCSILRNIIVGAWQTLVEC